MKFFKKKEIIDSKPLKEHKFKWLPYKIAFWFLVISLSSYGVYSFINTHSFQSPILFQNPIPLKQIYILSPIGTPSAKIVEPKPDIHKIVRAIYGLESTWGRHDEYCRSRGQWNGYGYAQNGTTIACFDSFEIVTNKVTAWIQDKLDKDWSVAKTLCYYNKGIELDDCDYYQDYLSLCKN